jgi:DNA repair photolyase
MTMKKSDGNMYTWVTHTHAHLGGECPHKCSYCYVDNPRFGRAPRYTGELRLIEDEFKVNYGSGNSIFIENCNDLFAREVPDAFIRRIMAHCNTWPDNTYVFQTKNPCRILGFENWFPVKSIFGTTIETNRDAGGNAPKTFDRFMAMSDVKKAGFKIFVTIEPILDHDVDELADWMIKLKPDFLNIGADSKGHGLVEPTKEKILALVEKLRKNGIEVREKHNLGRILEA